MQKLTTETPSKILYSFSLSHLHTGSPKALIELMLKLDQKQFVPFLLLKGEGELSTFLNKKGIKVFIKNYRMLSRKNIPMFLIDIVRFIIYFKRWKIGLLHANEIGWRDSYILAARMLSIPVVLHLHSAYPERDIKGNFNIAVANRIIVVSGVLRDNFVGKSKVLAKLICIPNGVDMDRFKKNGGIRKELGIENGIFVIGYIGQMRREKGVSILIESSALVLRKFPNTLFLMVGKDGTGEEGLTDELRKRIKELGLTEHYKFLGKRDDIPEIMNTIDLLVLPSFREALPKVILEAMSCQRCVVASDVGGIPEIIRDGENGLLVPPGDREGLERSVLSVLESDELRMRLAKAGYQTVKEHFSIERVIKRTEDLYVELISQKKGNQAKSGDGQK